MGLPFLSLESNVEAKINQELDFIPNKTVLHQTTTSPLPAISHNLYVHQLLQKDAFYEEKKLNLIKKKSASYNHRG